MPFRGYWALNNVEFANSSRTRAIVRRPAPTSDGVYVPLTETPPGSGTYLPVGAVESPPGSGLFELPPGVYEDPPGSGLYAMSVWSVSTPFDGCDLELPYDDTWPLLGEVFGHAEYTLESAPWYNPAIRESTEFGGVWVMSVDGLDTAPVQRDVTEVVGDGGAAGEMRYGSRPITFTALVIGATNAGARYGLRWLSHTLRQATGKVGAELGFFAAHPSDTVVGGDIDGIVSLLRTAYNVVLTAEPKVVSTSGHGRGARHRQASVFRVEFTLTALNPHIYARPDYYSPGTVAEHPWHSEETVPIEWTHAPGCEAPVESGETLPVLFARGCEPEQVIVPPSPPPTCSACMPVCSIRRRVWRLPQKLGIEPSAINIEVRNSWIPAGSPSVSLSMYWRPVGSTDPAARRNPLTINNLPPQSTVVADSIYGRGFWKRNGLNERQVGVITTPSGAPWRSTILDRSTEWELVVEDAGPGGEVIAITAHTRES